MTRLHGEPAETPLWAYAENPRAYDAAERGELPAEALSPCDRRLLVRQFVADGMTDIAISQITRWTLYTTARIRESIGLEQNQPPRRAA
ncbi:hypothetical protein [Nocardia bovistercoris]|uniref:Uncharacterized protein n=1 Tax=Nocardia bovistercoris TaxID=2785916 RepID=A0A931N4J7_9NOCA|nr:hypothetical protein [Nocardia bovistercoris]MBH0778777.1 hypothetical protein [Nocardia bovistercoris]